MHQFHLALSFVFLASPVLASETSVVCDGAARSVAAKYGIPTQVMLAITRVETGRVLDGELRPWPWAINADGQSHWFASGEDAATHVKEKISQGLTNIDLGCFQLNLRGHGAAFSSIEQMLDPLANADYAAKFLVVNRERTGNWVDAVAAYHSSTPEHAAAYVEKIEVVLKELTRFPDSVSAAADTPETTPNTNEFPLLRSGASGSIASIVPSASAARPLFEAAP